MLRIAISDLQQVLNGGKINLAGENFNLLGLNELPDIVQSAIPALPKDSPLRPALRQVVAFANLAIQGLSFSSPVLGSIGSPLTVVQTQLAGRTTPTDTYAVAIAVVLSAMLLTMLLASGLLAIERTENAYPRLIRGLITPGELLAEKVGLSAACAGVVSLLMAAFVSIFVHLDWGRFELWVLAIAFACVAFGALGVTIGALAREVSAASLMALLVSLPVAFVALVPGTAVSAGVKTLLDVIAFVFPFKAALEAISNAFSGTSPGIGLPLVHLACWRLVVLSPLAAAGAQAARRRARGYREPTVRMKPPRAERGDEQRDDRQPRADDAGSDDPADPTTPAPRRRPLSRASPPDLPQRTVVYACSRIVDNMLERRAPTDARAGR